MLVVPIKLGAFGLVNIDEFLLFPSLFTVMYNGHKVFGVDKSNFKELPFPITQIFRMCQNSNS